MAMNYCDYYLMTLSVYISRSLISPLGVIFIDEDKVLWIWCNDLNGSRISLYLQSDSMKMHPPVETFVSYKEPSRFAFNYYRGTGYLLEVKL